MRLFKRGRCWLIAVALFCNSFLCGCEDKVVVKPVIPAPVQAPKYSEPLPQHELALSEKLDYEKLIRELKNTSEPPAVDSDRRVIPGQAPKDRAEIQRVAKTLKTLIDHIGDNWTHLLDHIDDSEYCITLGYEMPRDTYNMTVGNMCGKILAMSLWDPAVVGIRDETIYHRLGTHHFLKAKHPNWKTTADWFREAKAAEKQYHELQLEYLRWAEAELNQKKYENRDDHAYTLDSIRQAISLIEENGKPIRIKSFNSDLMSIPWLEERF